MTTATPTATPPPPPLGHAHHAPPDHIRAFHKKLQRAGPDAWPEDIAVLDFDQYDASADDPLRRFPEYHRKRLKLEATLSRDHLDRVFSRFEAVAGGGVPLGAEDAGDVPVFTHDSVPGLQILPSLLPIRTQSSLLTTLLTVALDDTATHRNNLHAHYSIPSPCSFFSSPPDTILNPLDPTVHKPLTLSQALTKKLRWVTLGGQYDWTLKRYPTTTPPSFPGDVADLVTGCFPAVTPQAAIVNLYSPGDTLAPHRDISEASTKGLVSVSVGCTGVFVIGCDGEEEVLGVKLRSGDAVVMGGASRWAWHSVPKVLGGTCPAELEAWAGGGGGSSQWEGWMKGKRINLNVRQMWD
ncbi:hypothetical protein FN846DRAFT_898150 [Sphaerosporella brunnea]|uniref:mRNA N(6)-methyladenine demethylase n=1 Tax=Sphaerosporella brunnea TaxID=1250544 RepID=A0A5J5F1E2_9PEZI|nr:hypothetical protein FN846DRAFT_898150 [Sphaerosporella brunnea]